MVRFLSITRAKRLVRGMRPHHLGFSCFWAVTFVALSGFRGGAALGGLWHLYLVFEQVALPIAVGALAGWCAHAHRPLSPRLASLAGFMLSGGALLYFFGFRLGYGDVLVSLVAGVLLGCSCALFFLLWQTFFATEGQQHAVVYIPVSAAVSVVLYLLIMLLPLPALACASVAVLPFLATLTLEKSLSEVEMYAIEPLDRLSLRLAVRDLWRPVFCVSAIGFMWKLVSNLPLSAALGDSGSYATLLGFGAAALLVAFLELFLSRGFAILQVYQVLFPLITGVFLLPSFFGERYAALLAGMLMLGFEMVNLLLIVTCAVYAARHARCPVALYGLCIVPVLASLALGAALGGVLNPLAAFDFAQLVNILFVCIYLLSIVLLLVSRGKAAEAPASLADDELDALTIDAAADACRDAATDARRRVRVTAGFAESAPSGDLRPSDASFASAAGGGADGATAAGGGANGTPAGDGGTDGFERTATAERFLREGGLSAREAEVAGLLLRGHTMAAISCKLYISENTVRGHAKNIYRKFEVHSRQELVDLYERTLEG